MNQVRMYHPALDTHVSVPETAIDIHRVSGWVPADEYVPAAKADVPATPQVEPAVEEKKPIKAGSRQTAKEQ